MMKAQMTDRDVREDVRKSVKAMRETALRLQHDYKYLNHAESAGEDLASAIDAFDRQLMNDLDQHEEGLSHFRMMPGGG